MNIAIATIKSWNIQNAKRFADREPGLGVHLFTEPDALTFEALQAIQPKYVFFPHWSWLIPAKIYENFECIVFHMTDLPFGRGGSPLQNLIARGIEHTRISAIRVEAGLDTGDIYLKRDLDLYGTAEEIFMRASGIVFGDMIPCILNHEITPVKQSGPVTEFKRRKEEDGLIKEEFSLSQIFDYIRMLDGEGYPKAYIRLGKYRINFSRASLKHGRIVADVEIVENESGE